MVPASSAIAASATAGNPGRDTALARIDRLLTEGQADAAGGLADSLVGTIKGNSARARHERFVLLDSLVANFAGRTFPTLARKYSDRLLPVAEVELGSDTPDMARVLTRHSMLRLSLGDPLGASADASRALAIARRSPSMSLADRADCLENAAIIFGVLSEVDSCRTLLMECLALREQAFGPISYPVAKTRVSIANISRGLGDYAEGLREIERAVAIAEESLPVDDPRLLGIYNTQGALLGLLNDTPRCNQVFRRCVRLAERSYGLYHLDVARYMNNVGLSEYFMGNYGEARAYHDSALAIRTRIGDAGGVAESTGNLGLLAWRTGELARAESLVTHGLDWNRKGPSMPAAASAFGFLTEIRLSRGNLVGADSSLAQEQHIRSAISRPDHPGRIEATFREARLRHAQGDETAALNLALNAAESEREHLALTARTLAERPMLDYADSRPLAIDLALSLPPSRIPTTVRDRLWDAVLRHRGEILEEMATRQRVIAAASDSETRELLGRIARARGRLGSQILRATPGDVKSDSAIAASRQEIERLEGELAQRSLAFRRDQERSRLGLSEVRAALPQGSALVAFSVYHHVPERSGLEPRESELRYTALVLASGEATPEIVPLGACSTIDSLISAWRNAIVRTPADREAGASVRAGSPGDRLREAVWDPIASRVAGADMVFLVPDGALALLNFAALPADADAFLIERGPLFHVLSTERDLVPRKDAGSPGTGLFVVAAPDFDATAEAVLLAAATASPLSPGSGGASAHVYRGPPPTCMRLSETRFEPLQAAELEGREIAKHWRTSTDGSKTTLLLGAQAGEEEFKTLAPGHRVLHLATHGFFVGDQCEESPLRISGLAFAGANRHALPAPGEDDGILTSEEISMVDLRAVDWVVLSACDTGVGDVRPGEGVFGLRRAFSIAGARSLVMSLWPVEDAAARQWMAALYEARFARGLSTAESVRAASLALLERLRRRGAEPDPAIWGAFIGAGEWR
ncbi:MAG: CHAT domain-containing protein [Candidatus Eiseniibacteriota bacterium]